MTKKSRGKECRVCDGSKHRWDKKRKVYVPCVCLKRKQETLRYRKANIPRRYHQETWRTFTETYRATGMRQLLEVAATLKEGDNTAPWPMVYGLPARARSLAGALMLRSACDGEIDCMGLDLPTLIDAEFQPGRGSEFYRLPALVVEVGGEPANKWNKVVLEKLLHQRGEYDRFTMFLVDGDPPRVSTKYKSATIATAFTEQFFKVKVAAKEEE